MTNNRFPPRLFVFVSLAFIGLIIFLTVSLVYAGTTGNVNSLLRIEVSGPIQDLGVPVYAHFRDGNGKEYALVVASAEQLQAIDQSYQVLDTAAALGAYLVALERRKGARALAAQRFSILHDDGRRIILRHDPAIISELTGMGFDLSMLPPEPMVLRAAEPPLDTLHAVAHDPRVAAIIDEVSQGTLYEYVGNLSGQNPVIIGGSPYTLTTRETLSGTPIQMATQYVYEFMEARGLAVSYHNWMLTGIQNRNVIGSKIGNTKPEEIVLVTAHIDDAVAIGTIAPGADDNASGSTAVMMAVQAMASRNFERTLRFVFFTGEENGLLGSYVYAQQAALAGENIVAVYNMDMIAWDNVGGPVLQLHTRTPGNPGYGADFAIANLFVDVVNTYGFSSVLTPNINADGDNASDHASFWNRGFPAIMAIEDDIDDFNIYYHTINDSRANINMPYFTNYVKASLGTVAHLAQPAASLVTLTAPNGGESWNRNARRVITWNASGCSGTLKLTLWQNGGLIGTIADGVNPAAGSYAWAVGAYNGSVAPLGTGYTIKIEDNGSDLEDESNGVFSIVKISVKTPNGGESWQKGSTQNITWVVKSISGSVAYRAP